MSENDLSYKVPRVATDVTGNWVNNDLSDEAFDRWANGKDNLRVKAIDIWHEAVRRARSNPWQLFESIDLEHFLALEVERGGWQPRAIQIAAELKRRKAVK
jgi:hypothetical protein